MKRILFLSLIVALLSSCVGNKTNYHDLIGAQRVLWETTTPLGMVFVPQGSFIMGPSDQDVPFANVSTNQRVSVGAFYMDRTEITNNEYRQFVEWVEDSIIRTELEFFKTEGRGDDETNIKTNSKVGKTNNIIDWDKPYPRRPDIITSSDTFVNYYGMDSIVLRNKEIDGKTTRSKIFVKAYVDGKEVLDKTKYTYVYEEINYRKLSANRANNPDSIDKLDGEKFRGNGEGSGYVIRKAVQIYPNTTDFQGDYVYSNEETEAEFNFLHEAYDDYPVIGITWEQANAFCHWRTHIMNQFRAANRMPLLADYRLPTETEWEYAARGGLDMSPYPWGGPYTRNQEGCFLANFKPLRGNYSADGGHKAVKVGRYNKNNYGLYDMSGNVSEWTSTVFDETSSSYTNDMDGDNSNLGGNFDINGKKSKTIQRKVIRGGSWKDIAYYIQTSTRDYAYADESTSYIGFRCVMDFLGRSNKDKNIKINY